MMVTMEDEHGGGAYGRVVRECLWFPLWWYSEGLATARRACFRVWKRYAALLGVFVWMQNIFTPMFGRSDWQSRLISVFMRLVNVVGRGILVLLFGLVVLCAFLLYLFLPALAVVGIVGNLV